jgi:glycerol-3-phosphate dehydrogenase
MSTLDRNSDRGRAENLEGNLDESPDEKAPYWSAEWRAKSIEQLVTDANASESEQFDIVVVGGGITGAGIYREATARGLKVLLVEQKDFAWGTSSRSSKMVHGGLRYLGSGQLGLARDSVRERQSLMSQLKGLVDPLPFLMGHYKGVFPGPWVFNKLLAVYDFLAGKRYREFLKTGLQDFWAPGIKRDKLMGLTRFGDAVTDDSRLVMRVLQDGNERGGIALNYVRATGPIMAGSEFSQSCRVMGINLCDELSGASFQVNSRVIVNATGAWSDDLRRCLGKDKVIRPLRGSHLVVPFWRLPVAFSVSFFHPQDKRPVFVFPWEGQTVIGTTDLDHTSGLGEESSLTEVELSYLLDLANAQFADANLSAEDVLSTWSGVRPVVGDAQPDLSVTQQSSTDGGKKAKPSDATREHAIWDDAGMISIAGGKLTTFRLLALEVLEKTIPYLKDHAPEEGFKAASEFSSATKCVKPNSLSMQQFERLSGRYGQVVNEFIESAQAEADSAALQRIHDTDTLWQELIWACRYESVQHLDDLLLRRTRIGLVLKEGGSEYFDQIEALICPILGWDDSQWREELARYQNIMRRYYSLPFSGSGNSDAQGAA